jgi:hypothetical protein
MPEEAVLEGSADGPFKKRNDSEGVSIAELFPRAYLCIYFDELEML